MARERRRQLGVEAFTDNNDELEVDSEEDDADESEGNGMAKETAKAKARRAAEAEAAAEEDDDDEEDVEDEEIADQEDVDDDADEEDDEEDEGGSGFTPWIYHEDATWTLEEAFKNVDSGDNIVIYDADNDVWYKMMPIKVGELPAEPISE